MIFAKAKERFLCIIIGPPKQCPKRSINPTSRYSQEIIESVVLVAFYVDENKVNSSKTELNLYS